MNIIQNLGAWFSAFPAQMRLVEWTDVLDMVVLALAYFWIYRFIRDRRGGRLIIGIGALFVVFLVAVEISCLTSMAMRSVLVTCGVTVRITPVLRYW